MTIRPYALTTNPLESLDHPQNSLSNPVKDDDERSSKKLRIESSKINQTAHVILETHHTKDIDKGFNRSIIMPLSDKSTAEKESFIQAIELNPQDADSYFNLANILENDETAQLLNREIYTNEDLYLKAIELNPQGAHLYGNLAHLLKKNELIQLSNGETYTKKELYLKIIELTPQDANPYFNLANILENDEMAQFLNGEIYTKKGLYLKAMELNPQDANIYGSLASILENNELIQLSNGESYTKKELYLKAIELNSQDANPYFNLANILKNDQIVKFLSGKSYTKKELYLKAIDLNPHDANSYNNLALCLKDYRGRILFSVQKGDRIKLLSGKSYTKKELYLKAIELNPRNANFYYNLAIHIKTNEIVKLLSGEFYAKEDLYLKAIDLNPKNADLYERLAKILNNDTTIKLLDKKTYTNKTLYCKAIELNPTNANPYIKLASLLEKDEIVQISSEKTYTKKTLYRKVIDLVPDQEIPELAKRYLKCIYAQEIRRNPNHIEGYFDLISIIQDDTISLNDETEVNIEILLKKALNLDPIHALSAQFATAFFSTASHLSIKTKSLLQKCNLEHGLSRAHLLKEGDSLTLKNEEVISTKALYQHALPFLSLDYLKCKGNKEVGNYLSSRKPTLLQDGIKFTRLIANIYAYQKYPSPHMLMKIGDALHPEERVLLKIKTCDALYFKERDLLKRTKGNTRDAHKMKMYDNLHPEESISSNRNFYNKRTCYEQASLGKRDSKFLLRQAESLYPHEQLRKRDLFYQALEHVHEFSSNRLEAYTLLARILSRYELTRLGSKYLLIFGEELKNYNPIENKELTPSINSRYENSDHLVIDDDIYFIKKQEFLLELLKYIPSCEEAYVGLATNFQNTLRIHEKSYTSKESLYLKAIDLNPEYSLPYFLLGKELFNQKIDSIQLLNGVTLSCKQLLMRSIQLGTYESGAYHLAALIMNDREGILLFDEKTILSRGDLFIRAFELDFTRVLDLKNFISYAKRNKKTSP